MIREATMDDMPELMRMAKDFHYAANLKRYSAFEDSPGGWEAFIEKCITGADLICLVVDGGFGFATAVAYPAYWNSLITMVQETAFWIDPSHRGSGDGSDLLASIDDWARKMNAHTLVMGSSVDITPKKTGKFLRNNGFRLQWRGYSRRIS